MKKATAYAPASISLIFRVWKDTDLLQTGSTGVGFTVNKGVTTAVEFAEKIEVYFNGKKILFPTVESVIQLLVSSSHPEFISGSLEDSGSKSGMTNLKISIASEFPLGYGFGVSGASALSAAFALNKFLNLKKTEKELISAAHIAEVKNHTGLGNVTTQSIGGFLVKKTPGITPEYKRLGFVGKKIYCTIFSSLSTAKTLKGDTKKINNAADIILSSVSKRESLPALLDLSYEFAKESGLLTNKQVIQTIKEIRKKGGHASMHMLGNAVVSDRKPEGENVIELQITEERVKVL